MMRSKLPQFKPCADHSYDAPEGQGYDSSRSCTIRIIIAIDIKYIPGTGNIKRRTPNAHQISLDTVKLPDKTV